MVYKSGVEINNDEKPDFVIRKAQQMGQVREHMANIVYYFKG